MRNNRDIDKIIESVKKTFPNVETYQLKVTHRADDDGIWYFWLGESSDDEIQVENSYGQCPFLIETNRNNYRKWENTVEETVKIKIAIFGGSDYADIYGNLWELIKFASK